MSLLDQYCQNVLQLKGNMLEAQDLLKTFLAEIMIKIFHVDSRLQQQIFRNCNKHWNIVEQNLINYFSNSPIPIQTIFNENKYKNEGFISSDDDEPINNKKKVLVKRTKSIFREPQKNDDFKDEQIKIRDQVIQDMTVGYYKDIQHLKEMFLRKERQQDDDICDASYYDITKSFPAEIQFYIAQRIKEMSSQAKKEQTKLQNQITQQQLEIEKLKKTINQLISQADIIQQIKAILLLDRDLNRFWRGVQDVIGNRQIFEIFEKRIAGYGIDYKQIDELINQSQASYRLFQDFKQKIDDQYIQLVSSTEKEINQLKNQIKLLSDHHNGIEMEKEKDFIQIRQTLKSGIEYIYEMKENALRINYQQKLEQYAESIIQKDILNQVRKCIKGHALYKWLYIVMVEKQQYNQKLRKVKSFHLIKQDFSINLRGLIDNRVNDLKQQLKAVRYQFANEQLQSQQLEVELNQLKTKYQSILMNYEMQLHKFLYMQQHTQYLENQNKYFEKIFSLLMRKIGYANFEVNEKNIHLILEKSDQQIKQFYNKINQISNKDYEDLHELTNQLIKKSIFKNKLYQGQKSNTFCQTDIFDVSISLDKCIKKAEKNQQQLAEILNQQQHLVEQEIKQEQEQNQNLENEDIPNLLLSEHEHDEEEMTEQILVNKVSFERSTDVDINRINSLDNDSKTFNLPQSADNKNKSQQFSFLSKKKTATFSTRSKEVQTDIQVDCSINLVNKIFINDLNEFKKNVKEKQTIKEMRKTPQQSKPDLQNTFATLISQQNAKKAKKQTNLFQSIKHRPIEINCLQKLKTDVSQFEFDQNITFTNERMRIIFTPNNKKGRSVSKNI